MVKNRYYSPSKEECEREGSVLVPRHVKRYGNICFWRDEK